MEHESNNRPRPAKEVEIDWLARVCETIKRRRLALNMSQEEFSKRSGLHRTYVSEIEKGARNLSLKNLQRIAEALHTEPSVLLQEAETVRNE